MPTAMRRIPNDTPDDSIRRRRLRDRLAVPTIIAGRTIGRCGRRLERRRVQPERRPGADRRQDRPAAPGPRDGSDRGHRRGDDRLGQQRLRFAATIVNIGQGPFILRAQRPWLGGEGLDRDAMDRRTGGRVLDATDRGRPDLRRRRPQPLARQAGRGPPARDARWQGPRKLVKQGFCFFDTDPYQSELPGAPAKAHWSGRGCAGSFDTRVRMGLSVGWADKYPWHLLDERIDVTDLPDGTYRIREIADPHNEFEESDETNNETWVDVALKTNAEGLRGTTVVATGPAPRARPRRESGARRHHPGRSGVTRACAGPYYGPAPRSPMGLCRSGRALWAGGRLLQRIEPIAAGISQRWRHGRGQRSLRHGVGSFSVEPTETYAALTNSHQPRDTARSWSSTVSGLEAAATSG